MTLTPARCGWTLRDQVAVLTIDRPAKLNAFTPSMTAALMSHVTHLNEEPEVRAVVLTGTGRAFCAGSDIAGLDDYASPWEFGNRPDYCDTIRALRKPVIAAVNGYALGGGLELALGCDIRLAAETATFAAPEIKLGWIGGGGMSALLAHSIGPGNAAVMLLTGDPIDAATALRWGLVSEVLPAGGPGRPGRGTGRHHRQPGPDRGADRETEPARRVRDAARPGHRLRAPTADDLLRHRGRRGGPGRLRRAQATGVPGPISVPGPTVPGQSSGPAAHGPDPLHVRAPRLKETR